MKPYPLKVERELRGWSQAYVATAVGTNVRTVIRWEQGRTLPSSSYRDRLCALFGKNARELGLLGDAGGNPAVSVQEQTPSKPPVVPTPVLRQPSSVHPSTASPFWSVPAIPLPLIGRARELTEIKDLLASVRLLTLMGAGGIGKTRLSLELAHQLRPLFAGGVCFVQLAAVREPEQVMTLIARDLGLQEGSGSPSQRVQRMVHDHEWLLVLDNVEHVVQAAPELERLLADCPRLKVLVTSRAALRLASEYQYRLWPLAVPDLTGPPDRVAVEQSPSVQLFLQRARTLLPTFAVTEANAAALANICVRLDGLPLAIELAAARVNVLPPEALLPRLSRRLHVLTRGLPALPERQQTLRHTLAWSYDLLDAGTQRLFRLLSLFVGGFTVEAAESLCAAVMAAGTSELSSALDGLDTLIDNSLLQPAVPTDAGGQSRLQMLETIREFGRERLLESADAAAAQEAHACYYLGLAEQAAQDLEGPRHGKWFERLDQEYGNLQAAMEWMLAPETLASAVEQGAGKQTMALRLLNALRLFWMARGYMSEALRFTEHALLAYTAAKAEVTLPLAQVSLLAASWSVRLGNLERARVLVEQGLTYASVLNDKATLAEAFRTAGWVAHRRGQGERAFDCYERSLALFRELDDGKGIALTMLNLAFLLQTRGDHKQAAILFEEVLARRRALHDTIGTYDTLYVLAQVLFGAEEHPPLERIHALLQEGLALAQEAGDRQMVAAFKGLLGWVVSSEGKLSEARGLVEECVRFFRGDDQGYYGNYLAVLGEILRAQGDGGAAQSIFDECLAVGKELGDQTEVVASALEGMAELAQVQGQHAWAVQLWAKAGQRREEIGVLMIPREQPAHARLLNQLRAYLGEHAFTELWEEGRSLSLDEVWSARQRPFPNRLSEQTLARVRGMEDETALARAFSKGETLTPAQASASDQARPAQPTQLSPGASPSTPTRSLAYPVRLTAREVEVLRYIALGLTDAQVAEQLVISHRTVTTHLTSIYNKLGVNSRAAATRFAVEHHLLPPGAQ